MGTRDREYISIPHRVPLRPPGAQPVQTPPLFVYSITGTRDLRNLASQGAVQTAIAPRPDFDKDAKPTRKASAEEIVALRYDTSLN